TSLNTTVPNASLDVKNQASINDEHESDGAVSDGDDENDVVNSPKSDQNTRNSSTAVGK
ncbi:hypothetical protein Tco_1269469, partial [Tanacetum coccineum]